MVSSPFREPLSPGTRLQDYRLERVVGEGSFSLIYAARQGGLRLPVAIKEFFPQGCWREGDQVVPGDPWDSKSFAASLESFYREGAILRHFHHPGIVRVSEIIRANGTAYLVQELLQGEALSQLQLREGNLPLDKVLELTGQMGSALMEIHGAGLLHCDLKPDNLFLTSEGQVVVVDFGTARGYRNSTLLASRVATVSPGYSPLEQYERKQNLTPAADVYALAATMYDLLLGYPPIESPKRAQGVPLPPLPVPNTQIRSAIMDALQLHPLRRTGAVSLFLEQLGLESHREVEPRSLVQKDDLFAHLGGTEAAVLHQGSERLYTAGRDGRFRIWSWPGMQLLGSKNAHTSYVKALAVSEDGRFLVTGARDGSLKLWSTEGEINGHVLLNTGPAVTSLAFHPAQGYVAASFVDGTCRLLGPGIEGEVVWKAHADGIHRISIHPRGKVMATAGEDSLVHLWSLPDARLESRLKHSAPVYSARFHPEGKGLLTCASDFSLHLWDWETGREERSFIGHRAEVWDAQFSADPDILVTLCSDHSIYGVRATSGRPVMAQKVEQGLTNSMAVDSQTALLVTGCADGQIRTFTF